MPKPKTKTTRKTKTKEPKKVDVPIVDVYNLSGKKIDRFKLDAEIFDAEINKPLIHQAISMYLANQRQGNASTKTKGEVRGGGKKPWRQKGTGRARAGSIRSPLWRGGGITFGPRPRDFSYAIPKKMKRLALISSLSAKAKDNEIIVLEKDLELAQPKTKEMVRLLEALKSYNARTLFLYSKRNENLMLSCRNIKKLSLKLCGDINAYDVFSNSRVMFSRDTHDILVKALKEWSNN